MVLLPVQLLLLVTMVVVVLGGLLPFAAACCCRHRRLRRCCCCCKCIAGPGRHPCCSRMPCSTRNVALVRPSTHLWDQVASVLEHFTAGPPDLMDAR